MPGLLTKSSRLVGQAMTIRQQREVAFYARHPDVVETIMAQLGAARWDDLNAVEFYTFRDEKSPERRLYAWNVTLAKALAKAPGVPIIDLDVQATAAFIEANPRRPIDAQKLGGIDLAKSPPALAIMATWADGTCSECLIDGMHRMVKAYLAGRPTWPVKLLSREAGLACALPQVFAEFMAEVNG